MGIASRGPRPAGQDRRATRDRLLPAAGALLLAGVGLAAVWIGVGLLLTRSGVDATDRAVAQWLVDHRTPFYDGLTRAGTLMGQTMVKIIVTAVAAVLILWRLRSWRAASFVVLATAFEGAVFLVVTTVVGRPRPDVPRLEAVTVNSSFPSGHTGAAAAYAAIALVVLAHTRRQWLRALVIVLAVLVPLAVAASRMYRGAHYLTDVVAGLALGWVSVVVVLLVIRHWFGPPTGGAGADHRSVADRPTAGTQ